MFKRRPHWVKERKLYTTALEAIVEEFPFEPDEQYADNAGHRARLHAFSTGLIRHLIGSFRLAAGAAGRVVYIEPEAVRIVEVLKQFIWEYVIEDPALAVPQSGQRLAIKTVFDRLVQATADRTYYLFPSFFRQDLESAKSRNARIRIVADCISGMTERDLIQFYLRIQGTTT
jgi:dGTP triphosphohydrolase